MSGAHGAVAAREPLLDFVVKSALWKKEPESEAVIKRAIAAAATEASSGNAEIAIVLTDDSAIRALNRQWRNRDQATNVLSFPAAKLPGNAGMAVPLGDIVIAFETLAEEARAEGIPFTHHLAHLAVHGYLHLMGHDHEAEDDAQIMERLETGILARLGVPDPYARRSA